MTHTESRPLGPTDSPVGAATVEPKLDPIVERDGTHAERLLRTQCDILEMIASGVELSDVLDALCRNAEGFVSGAVCTVMRLEGETLHLVAAPSASDDVRACFEVLPVGTGTCGAAARTEKMVIVADTRIDPLWADLQDVVENFGIRSCWSIPILAERGGTFGTFGISQMTVGEPTPDLVQLLETAGHLAAIAFDRDLDERQQRLMVQELDHRVKNNLTTVLAVAERTAATSGGFAEFMPAFTGRVRSMAMAHEMLAESNWAGADLRTMIGLVVWPYTGGTADRVICRGPALILPSTVASAMCMVLHELATNAAKYGALFAASGRIAIEWTRDVEPGKPTWLSLDWRESGAGAAGMAEPGFGMDLIEGVVRRQLQGTVEMVGDEHGVRCTMRVPLTNGMHPFD